MLPANAVRGVVALGGSRANIDRTDVCDSSLYVLRISETPTPRVKRRRAHSLSHCYHAQEPTTSALIHDGIACYRTAALA